jgi:hypothetical protein
MPCTRRVAACYGKAVPRESNTNRVNVTLDDIHAEKLRRLAERTHVNEGTLARSLLTTALDEADPDPRNVTALLDGIAGAFDRAELGLAQIRDGAGKPLTEL